MMVKMKRQEFNSEKCGCKGMRSCLICLPEKVEKNEVDEKLLDIYHYCRLCGDKAWKSSHHNEHKERNGTIYLTVRGIYLAEEVITCNEEMSLINAIDCQRQSVSWVHSQSGRRKQDYGPKVNFRRRKLNLASFKGFPRYAIDVFEKLKSQHSILSDFLPVELCNLEYFPERGSRIDPHFDDTWIWGERLVTLNLSSPTVLTLTRTQSVSDEPNIYISMPRRSLIVLYDEARYQWLHSIKRIHITEKRIAMTFRELTKPFLHEGDLYESQGREWLELAKLEFDIDSHSDKEHQNS